MIPMLAALAAIAVSAPRVSGDDPRLAITNQ